MIAIPVLPPRTTHRIPAVKRDPLEQSAAETLRQAIEKKQFLLDDKQRIAGLRYGLEIRAKVTDYRLGIVEETIEALRKLVGEMEPLPF